MHPITAAEDLVLILHHGLIFALLSILWFMVIKAIIHISVYSLIGYELIFRKTKGHASIIPPFLHRKFFNELYKWQFSFDGNPSLIWFKLS